MTRLLLSPAYVFELHQTIIKGCTPTWAWLAEPGVWSSACSVGTLRLRVLHKMWRCRLKRRWWRWFQPIYWKYVENTIQKKDKNAAKIKHEKLDQSFSSPNNDSWKSNMMSATKSLHATIIILTLSRRGAMGSFDLRWMTNLIDVNELLLETLTAHCT